MRLSLSKVPLLVLIQLLKPDVSIKKACFHGCYCYLDLYLPIYTNTQVPKSETLHVPGKKIRDDPVAWLRHRW